MHPNRKPAGSCAVGNDPRRRAVFTAAIGNAKQPAAPAAPVRSEDRGPDRPPRRARFRSTRSSRTDLDRYPRRPTKTSSR